MAKSSKWQELERRMKRSFKVSWKLYWESPYGKVGLIILLIFGFMAIAAPILTPYTPDFEAPSKDALVTYLYAFNTKDPIYGMDVGYTQLYSATPQGGDWLILNHGKYLEGVFVQNPKIANPENQSASVADVAPWEVKNPPIKFKLNMSDIHGLGDERVMHMVYLSPSTSDLQYHYNGKNQRPDFDGELVFITQKHMVIYDMANFINKSYSRYKVISLGFTPSWVVADTTSTGELSKPVVYASNMGIYPARYIMVGNSHNFAMFFYYYTYSGDPNLPPINDCLREIFPVYKENVSNVGSGEFETIYGDYITMKPLLFYNDATKSKNQNIVIIPLHNKTIIYTRFDEATSQMFPSGMPYHIPSTIAQDIKNTKIEFQFSLTAEPGFYPQSPDLGSNPIFMPTSDSGKAVIHILSPNGNKSKILSEDDIDLGSGSVTATPQIFYSGGNYTVYAVKYDGKDSYLYTLMGTMKDGFSIVPFTSKSGTIQSIPIKNEKIVYDLFVGENSQFFLMSETKHFYLFDINQYQLTGDSSVIPFSYYHWKTKQRGIFPYPSGSKLDKFIFVGSLQGSRYSAKAAAYDIFGAYYCNDTHTVGLTLLKGESRLPLPPGKYISGNWYILGTDAQGHDIWTWLVYGSRVAFLVGITAAFIQVVIGSLYGVFSGFKGGWIDTVLMRFADIMLTLPFLPIILILTSILGRSIWNIIFVLGIFGWAGIARVIRAQTMSLRNRPFVDAARVAGASGWRIMVTHIMPNVLPFAFLYMTLGVAGAILSEASLSFLGLGDPKAISWGQMLSTIQTSGATMYAWWWLLPPGLAITLISLGFYLVGRAFDEILNPRLRKR